MEKLEECVGVLCDRKINVRIKGYVHDCLMTSNYGLRHGWAETKAQEKMDVAEMRML